MTRRDLSALLPLLGLLDAAPAQAQPGKPVPPLDLHSGVFEYDKLPLRYSSGGAATRPVLRGRLPTGEVIELHETTLLPGQMPHPAHRHRHTELMLVREGTLEFILEGKSEHFGPGGVAYAASGEFHGLRNAGTTPANYFVIAIGTDPKPA